MTGGFLSVSIMRPNLCLTILHVSILAGLLLTLNAENEDSEDSDCSPALKARRHTVHEASLGGDLRINCTVTFCNNSPPIVSWYKSEKSGVPVIVNRSIHIKTEWNPINHTEGISLLIFHNIQINDSGQYRCQSGADVGHFISVSVNDNGEHPNETGKNETNNTSDSSPPSPDNMLMYVYSAAGIVAFVIVVIIISVISMLGCKEKPKKKTSTENQYMAIPMMEPAFPHTTSPRESPSVPPTRRSARKKTTPPQRNEPTSPEEHLYGVIKEDDETQRNVVQEEGSSVLYAALNHQLAPVAPARPRIQMEETSEYAAIRVA